MCSGGSAGNSCSAGNGNSKSKRMRTSFKHHQLRTMKAYFSVNHNPDAKQLKQLAQKTGLTKRVLQVIFNFLFVYNVDCNALSVSGMWKREKPSGPQSETKSLPFKFSQISLENFPTQIQWQNIAI